MPAGPATVTLIIDRPARRNALDVATCDRLVAELADAVDAGARAVVLTGAGDHFCAGADLALVHGTELNTALRSLLAAVVAAPVPVVSAVHGAALGAGTQLAMASDLRVVDPSARFGIPAARLGLMVDHWTVERLVALAGAGPARAVLLGASELGAEEALRLGFAQRAAPRRADVEVATAWAGELAALAPLSQAGHKLLLNQIGPTPPPGPDSAAGLAYERAWASADGREGIAAFRERRPPRFEGR